MDELKKQLKNVSLYDVKAYVRKAQNVVYNYTEMEARVREATNNEPWGASSTLMQKIAAGTYNYREREEIIGMVFRRFTEKAANEWRQIYKSLQLLEYLLKNGSERFVDDARANLSLITMLRSFHYIDSQGRDQGINVRTKAKALVEILNNDQQLRQERKKARDNAKKFQGVAGGIGNGDALGPTGDDFGTYEGRVFGDGGVYGQRFEESGAAGSREFEEYEENGAEPNKSASKSKPMPAKPEKEVDLFSFDEPSTTTTSAAPTASHGGDEEFDEFGDFQGSESATAAQQFQPFQAPPSQSNFQALQQSNFQSQPVQTQGPAPVTKQDAFSSLFQSAATKAHKPAGSQSSFQAPQTSAYQSPQALQASKPTQSQYQPQSQSHSGEIDLLDL